MTGLILAGADPLDAVLVQVVVMFLVLASAATTSTVMAVGVARRLFTADHRLVDASTEPPTQQQGAAHHRHRLERNHGCYNVGAATRVKAARPTRVLDSVGRASTKAKEHDHPWD